MSTPSAGMTTARQLAVTALKHLSGEQHRFACHKLAEVLPVMVGIRRSASFTTRAKDRAREGVRDLRTRYDVGPAALDALFDACTRLAPAELTALVADIKNEFPVAKPSTPATPAT